MSKTTYTLADVAKTAGVSRSLASLALRNERGVGEETRKRILDVAADLNYVPNYSARNLAANQTNVIGVVVRDIASPFLAALAKAIDLSAESRDWEVVFSIAAQDDEHAEKAIRSLQARRVQGLILIDTPRDEAIVRRVALQLPTIYVGRHMDSEKISSISNDDDLGARLVARHLLSLGHRSIAQIGGGQGAGAQRRRAGFLAELANAGIVPHFIEGDYTIDAGAQGADALLAMRERPTAVFASNDLTALGALNRFLELGLSVPEDIAVVGYDDMPMAGTKTIAMTTVRQPIDSLASQSLTALVNQINEPKSAAVRVLVAPELVARRSTLGDGGR